VISGNGVSSLTLMIQLDCAGQGHSAKVLDIRRRAGEILAQYNLGLELMNSEVPEDVLRGRQWMERAARAGDRAAAQLLKSRPAAVASNAKVAL
jgi:TPR repeat protein